MNIHGNILKNISLICEAWPPEKGEAFNTCVLCWSFADQAFWRGKSVAMSEVMVFARSIASSRFREAFFSMLCWHSLMVEIYRNVEGFLKSKGVVGI